MLRLQCRRILGGRNLVRARNIVAAAIFDFMTVEDWGEWRKKESGEGEGRKKKISLLSLQTPRSL